MYKPTGSLAGKVLFITGASRGIGKAIALRAAQDGARIIVASKTDTPHPKLPGTIHSAAEEIEKAGGQALAVVVDVRSDEQVQAAIEAAVQKFGGIDILINNASAIALSNTGDTPMKRYDLMQDVNVRGTYLCTKYAAPYLEKAANPHVLTMCPPLQPKPKWMGPHLAYSLSKFGMSMCVMGHAEEYRAKGIAVNALWPKTAIATAAIRMLIGEAGEKMSRRPEIVADAAHFILSQKAAEVSGQYFIDEEVLRGAGVEDFRPYAVDPTSTLAPDLFLEP